MSNDAQYASINGLRLHYIDRGQGPPVVLLHGLGATHADWEAQIEHLTRIFRVIAPDLRGHGESDRLGPYSVERFASDILQLTEQLRLKDFALAGHSMGGAVAMQMAILRPDRVSKLVLSNTLPDFRVNSFAKRCMLWYRLLTVRLFGMARLSAATHQRMFPRPEQAELRALVAARNGRIPKQVYLDTVAALTRWSVADRLAWLRMPVLVLASEHDYFEPREAQFFSESLPDGRCRVFEDAHHGLPMEHPDEVNRLVMEFLMPGSSAPAAKGEATLNWLRVDARANRKIDVQSLLKKPV